MNHPEIEIVIPVFNEIEIVAQLHQRVLAVCHRIGLDFRIVYVDDGSRDGTPEWLVENAINKFANPPSDNGQQQFQGRVSLVRLSRNFGHAAAINAGLESCEGSSVVVMDGDLQDPPELIEQMVSRWKSGDEIVIAQRTRREETFLRGLAFKAFHRLFKYLADSDIPCNTGTFCLMDRRAADAINAMKESHRFLPGLRAWVGYKQSLIKFERPPRGAGQPKQTFVRLFKYALDAIFAFSYKPLRMLTACGGVIFVSAFAMAIWFIGKRLLGWENASAGFTTLITAVVGLGGFQLMALGLLGEYIGRIYDEVKARPQHLVAQQIDSEMPDAQEDTFEERRAA